MAKMKCIFCGKELAGWEPNSCCEECFKQKFGVTFEAKDKKKPGVFSVILVILFIIGAIIIVAKHPWLALLPR